MADPLIHFIFMGLIVFVPDQKADQTTSMTAYLVRDGSSGNCDHVPKLIVEGSATVDSGTLCSVVGKNLECSLEGFVAVALDTSSTTATLPPKPSDLLPKSNDKDDGGSPSWLIRMANVEKSAAKPKTHSQLQALADAEFTFGWEHARTCALDENSKRKVRPFKFIEGAFEAGHRQALAESVMFVARATANPVLLTLTKGAEKTVVNLDCSSGRCPVLQFSNQVSDSCHPLSIVDHFHLYYQFSEKFDRKLHPNAVGGEADGVTYDCAAEIASSAAPSFSVQGKQGFFDRWRERRIVKSEAKNIRALIQPKPSDRIICPPVVLGE